MPSDEFMDVLINCLQEDIQRPIVYLKGSVQPNPGTLYFLSSQFEYQIEGDSIKARHLGSGQRIFQINRLLQSCAESSNESAVIILSGMIIDGEGIDGIRALKEKGARVLATSKGHTPVFQMIEELLSLNLVDELYPPASLMANLEFKFPGVIGKGEERWLIVDDEAEVREVIGEILELENISCDFAQDGLDALGKIQKFKYSALVLDMKMPELDGYQTLMALETIEPYIPTLIITGYDDDQTWAAGKRPNVVGILLKPFTGGDLKRYLPRLRVMETQ
jgi:CheY-like chemotaxis protein